MDEMRVYIANLGKYTEGESVGAWFDFPLDEEIVREKIGLSGRYEEYAIQAYEGPVEIEEYASIDELNELYDQLQEVEEHFQPILKTLLDSGVFNDLEDFVSKQGDVYLRSGCHNMSDIAKELVKGGLLGEVPERIQYCIDYEKLGRDLEVEGTYLDTSRGIVEVRC